MQPTIVRKVERPDRELVRRLGELGVATVHEAQGRTGLLRHDMRPIDPAARAAGSAVTVSCHPGDNLMIHAAIEFCTEGDVVVVRRRAGVEIVTLAEERLAKEAKNRERLRAGTLGVDMYGLREKLRELGVRYVDELEPDEIPTPRG